MEIINYVQQPRRKSSSVRFFRNTAGAYKIKTSSVPTGTSAYILKTKEFSFKKFFAGVWHVFSDVCEFFKERFKTILIIISALCVVAGFVYFGLKLFFDYENHTGPIAFSENEKNDYDNLDKFMSNFALETPPSVDSDGNLLSGKENDITGIFSQPVSFQTYKVKSGDTISGISLKFGLSNISTLISVNDISNVRQLAAGQKLKIPSMDGVVYTVKKGDSINSIVDKYKVQLVSLLDVNELATETLTEGQVLFIPGAGLDKVTLKNAMGELFILPIAAKFTWSSPYGWRIDPIANVKSFHSGTDMACPQGTPILASQSGKVSTVGFNRVYGNYIILDHGNGYQTLYAHMYKTIAKKGQWVSQGTRIGLVGTTGYSTGPHLHFMVYKNGNRIDPMTILSK